MTSLSCETAVWLQHIVNLLVISDRLKQSFRGAEMLITQSAPSVQQWQTARLRVCLWVLELKASCLHHKLPL